MDTPLHLAFTAGEMIDASIMNTYLRDNLLYFKGSASAVTIENDLTVASLTVAGLVDGVDVSSHAALAVMTAHTGGMGDHTHLASGSMGGLLDVAAVVSSDRISLSQFPLGGTDTFFRGTGSTSPEYNNR